MTKTTFKLPSQIGPLLAALQALLLTATACPALAKDQAPKAEFTHATSFTNDEQLAARINKAIDNAIEQNRIVGTVVVVAKDGRVVYKRAAGFSDRENKKPMKQDAIFRLASMSKTIVSAAALKLVEEGKIKLDDPVSKYLPNFQPKLADGSAPPILISQLLSHTSGLGYGFAEKSDGPYHRAKVSDGLDQPGLSMAENLSRLSSAPLLSQPGTKWNYSLSIDVLGAVLEQAANSSLPEIVRSRVTAPLAMTDTDFKVAKASRSRLTRPYYDNPVRLREQSKQAATAANDTQNQILEPLPMQALQLVSSDGGCYSFAPDRLFNEKSFPSGGAGISGTAEDYLKFLEAIRTSDKKLLNANSIKLMTTSQIGKLSISPGGDWGFTYGSSVLLNGKPEKGPYNNGTLQWGGVYGHHWFVDPVARLSVVELTNTTVEGMSGPFSKEIVKSVYGSKP
ncbi:serine hydrolase domain-containing protein [soil metagenome]